MEVGVVYLLYKAMYLMYTNDDSSLLYNLASNITENIIKFILNTPNEYKENCDINYIDRVEKNSSHIYQNIKYNNLENFNSEENLGAKIIHLGTRLDNEVGMGTFVSNSFVFSSMITWYLLTLFTGEISFVEEEWIEDELSVNKMPESFVELISGNFTQLFEDFNITTAQSENNRYNIYYERKSEDREFPFYFLFFQNNIKLHPTSLSENIFELVTMFMLETFASITPMSILVSPNVTILPHNIYEDNNTLSFLGQKNVTDSETFAVDISIYPDYTTKEVSNGSETMTIYNIKNFIIYVDMCPEWTDPMNPFWLGFGYKIYSQIPASVLYVSIIILIISIITSIYVNKSEKIKRLL